MRINKIKKLEETEIEIIGLEVKIVIERMRDKLDEFEIKILKAEAENKLEVLKQTEKAVRKKTDEIKELEVKLKVEEIISGIISITSFYLSHF